MLDVYKGSTLDCYTWNDMNEPSVLNGSEVSNKPPMFRQGPGAVIELSEGFVDYANPIATYAADSQIKGDLTPESLDVMVTTSGRPGVVFNEWLTGCTRKRSCQTPGPSGSLLTGTKSPR